MRVLDFISKLSSHYCLTNLTFEHKNANNKLCIQYKNVHQLSICIQWQFLTQNQMSQKKFPKKGTIFVEN